MNPRLTHWLAVVCLILSACSSKQEFSDDPMAFPEKEEELAYIPTYSKTLLSGWPKGRVLSSTDISRVRLGEQVHAYHVGRLPSHDRREMHEAHSVYRVEQDARWDTRLPATPMDSRGVVLGVIEPSRNAVPQDAVVDQERQSLLAKSRQLEITMARLSGMQTELEKKKAAYTEAESTRAQIDSELLKTMQELNVTKENLNKAMSRIEELEEAEKYRLKTSSQGLRSSTKSPK